MPQDLLLVLQARRGLRRALVDLRTAPLLRKHCLVQSTGARLTVVFLTFSVLAQGGAGGLCVGCLCCITLSVHRTCRCARSRRRPTKGPACAHRVGDMQRRLLLRSVGRPSALCVHEAGLGLVLSFRVVGGG